MKIRSLITSLTCVFSALSLGSSILNAQQPGCLLDLNPRQKSVPDYKWTTDHMHIGVRWQPFIGRPGNNEADAKREVITKYSSYVQFWVSWASLEPTARHTNYKKAPSPGLKAIEHAVDHCQKLGVKVEFVFFHAPAWATVSGKSGGERPKPGLYPQYVKRVAEHFKGRVHAYQLAHEANLQGLMNDADMEFYINEVFIKGAETVRAVYDAEPKMPVIVSTSGMSPCEGCGVTQGLADKGGKGVNQFYDELTLNKKLMSLVDGLNLNVSDQNDGYGNMDGHYVPSVWGNYELVRGKLNERGYANKGVLSAESWISWDAGRSAVDVNGDGVKNEKDAYSKAVTIYGQCLERGLNTLNLPWSDNSSGWSMGLTKRLDYNGRVKKLNPEIVIPANDGGPDVVTTKLRLGGDDENFVLKEGAKNEFTVENYINPADPNHLHYYVWRWYAQIAGGSDETVRHALAGKKGNDIVVTGSGFTGEERYRISSYNRTRKSFTVLVYASGGGAKQKVNVKIPATVQSGQFKGEGFKEGQKYQARVITKDISIENGSDVDHKLSKTPVTEVKDGILSTMIPVANKFMTIEFVAVDE